MAWDEWRNRNWYRDRVDFERQWYWDGRPDAVIMRSRPTRRPISETMAQFIVALVVLLVVFEAAALLAYLRIARSVTHFESASGVFGAFLVLVAGAVVAAMVGAVLITLATGALRCRRPVLPRDVYERCIRASDRAEWRG